MVSSTKEVGTGISASHAGHFTIYPTAAKRTTTTPKGKGGSDKWVGALNSSHIKRIPNKN